MLKGCVTVNITEVKLVKIKNDYNNSLFEFLKKYLHNFSGNIILDSCENVFKTLFCLHNLP